MSYACREDVVVCRLAVEVEFESEEDENEGAINAGGNRAGTGSGFSRARLEISLG